MYDSARELTAIEAPLELVQHDNPDNITHISLRRISVARAGQTDSAHACIIPSLRWCIGGILFASTVINYIDRQTLSILAPYLKHDYHWTNVDYANIAIAFRIAYSL